MTDSGKNLKAYDVYNNSDYLTSNTRKSAK